MIYRRAVRMVVCAATLGAVTMGPVSGASASSASIRAAIKSYSGKVDVAEGHVVSALGEYKTSKEPAGVQAALKEAVTVLAALKAKVAVQSTGRPRVKKAKTKIEQGLQGVIVAYKGLEVAFGEKATSPEAASAEAKKAEAAVKKGIAELREGVKLLG
jgi:hypothetical protein